MEAQSVLNPDIGKLWKERRKYAGAVIRKAAEFELQRTPDSDEINNLVSKYSDWVIESLMSKDAPDFTGVDNESQQGLIGQQKMQKLIDSYCRTMFAQGDKQILASNPDLGYLLGIKTQAGHHRPHHSGQYSIGKQKTGKYSQPANHPEYRTGCKLCAVIALKHKADTCQHGNRTCTENT